MRLFEQLHEEWQELLGGQAQLLSEIEAKIDPENVAPVFEKIMAAYQLPPSKIKVVIFGQDPYPTAGHAQGLAFSVSAQTELLPASLRNIFKELSEDIQAPIEANGDLHRWSKQGVFLLNRVLTTTPGSSLAHIEIGWQNFTSETARVLGQIDVVAILWGKKAHELSHFFKEELVISSPHPSPLSAYRGFFGSKPFSQVNEILIGQGKIPIQW